MKILTVVLLLIANLLCTFGSEFKRVCYFTNWSNNIQVLKARFQLVDIDPSLCTHIIYAFADIDTTTKRLIPSAKDDDNGQLGVNAKGRFFNFTALKKDNPKLTTLLSVGGATFSGRFSSVSTNREDRLLFARNCRIFLRDRDFDGLDVDWEYPTDIYRDDFTELLKALRNEFEKDGKERKKSRLLLTIAAAGGNKYITESYNIPQIVQYVDFINVMAYDYFGPWSELTGFSSPLYSRLSNRMFDNSLSQDWTMRRWIKGGAKPEMLVMGTTGAGVSFELNNTRIHNVGAVVNGPGKTGPLLLQTGHLSYFEICAMIKKGATVKWDDEQKMAYLYTGNQWVGYDTPRSMREKVKYAIGMGLGGIMFWSFDLDDFFGSYCNNGRFPLLKAIRDAATKGNFSRFTTEAPSAVTTKTPSAVSTKTPSVVSIKTPSVGQNHSIGTLPAEGDKNDTSLSVTGSMVPETTQTVITTQKSTIKTQNPEDFIKVFILDGSESLRPNCFHLIVLLTLTVLILFIH